MSDKKNKKKTGYIFRQRLTAPPAHTDEGQIKGNTRILKCRNIKMQMRPCRREAISWHGLGPLVPSGAGRVDANQ